LGRKKILVLGSSGMAGHVVTTCLEEKEEYDVTDISRSRKLRGESHRIDACNLPSLEDFLNGRSYDVIINCIGVLNRQADRYPDRAILLNAFLPRYLERRFQGSATKIIQIGTDCVFSGKTGSYTETSFRDGETVYARTKALGEIGGGRSLTFRTSLIGPEINPDGVGLFHWFMKSEGEVCGYANSVWTGITTLELAKALEWAVREDVSGIYHLVPSKSITKYELLLLFRKVFRREDIQIRRFLNDPVDKSLVNTRRDFVYRIPSYEQMLTQMREWMLRHLSFYPFYAMEKETNPPASTASP
jgi:dTDP-4-dehydrorhamnose reductase